MQEENASILEGLLTALLSEGLMIKSVSEFTILLLPFLQKSLHHPQNLRLFIISVVLITVHGTKKVEGKLVLGKLTTNS